MPRIKTREIHKGSIKTIDRAQDLSARMRTIEPKTKDSRSSGDNQESASIAAYGEKRTSSMVKDAGGRTAETMDAASRWGARKIQERRRLIRSRRELANGIGLTESTMPSSNVSKSMSKPLSGQIRAAASKDNAGKAGIRTVEAGSQATEAQIRKAQAEQGFRAARKLAERRIRKQTEKAAQLQTRQSRRIVRDAGKPVRRIGRALKYLTESTKALSGLFLAGGWASVLIILICILFGAAFYYFGDSSADTSYTPVSPEVEAYTLEITAAAKKYGIEDYVELIKAVMMQESGGRGEDPMQCSASGYNRSGKKITDPKVSIDVGIHTLAECIRSAGVKDPTDLDRIKLVAQGYNFGNGYIDWAKKKYGGYSAANAAEFSRKHAGKSGTYGDKLYAVHVLRYYPYGNYEIGLGNGNIVNIARAQLGNKGGAKFWSWYGFHSRVEWCACFVSWCADQGGYLKSNTIPKFSVVGDGANWFKQKHEWQSRTYKPAPGDIIFFTWSGGPLQHVGIVEKCNGKVVTTIEGNSTDACRRRTYPVGSSCIAGYGTPAYPVSSSGRKTDVKNSDNRSYSNLGDAAEIVYRTVIESKCRHRSGAMTLEEIRRKRITTCNTSVSVSLQLAGILQKGRKIGHTHAVGSNAAVRKKNTISSAIYGTKYLRKDRCQIVKIGKKYSQIPAEYKKRGVVYIQDSNSCISAGGGNIYSTNEGRGQMKHGIYVKNEVRSGYPFSSPILYVIVPK